jgi:hypothetical protein
VRRRWRRQWRRSGIDPIEHRKAARAAQALADAKAMTFDQCRDAFIAANSPGRKNEKHRDQWSNTTTLCGIASWQIDDTKIACQGWDRIDQGLIPTVREKLRL